MNTGIGLTLFFLGAFALILAMIRLPSLTSYTGGMFVALFVAGSLYVWGNAWRQGRMLEEKEGTSTQTSSQPATEAH